MMKKFIIGTVGLATIGGLFLSVPTLVRNDNPQIQEQQRNKAWFAKATQSIAESEYYIRFQEDAEAYQSVNRSNNYRVSYKSTGFSIEPRNGNNDWAFNLSLKAIHKGGTSLAIVTDAEMITEKERMAVVHPQFDIEYINSLEGMRQNFIVREKPEGEGKLTVELHEHSELTPVKASTDDVLLVGADNKPALWYKDLKVWDANGKELSSFVSVDNETIRLIVEDNNAV